MGRESMQPISSFWGEPLGEAYVDSEGVSVAGWIGEEGADSADGKHEAGDSRRRILLGGISSLQDAPEDKGCGRGANTPRPAFASHHCHEQQSHLHIRGCESRGRRLDSESRRDLRGALHRATRGFALLAGSLMLAGCGLFGGAGRLKIGDNSVTPVANAAKPATLETLNAGETIRLSAGSRFIITRFKAVPGVPATKDSPAIAPQPEREVTEINPASDTQWQRTEATVKADSGTVDTSLAAKKIDAQENRILLYGALGMLVGAGIFFWLHYPSPALMCAGGAVILFLCWKMAGLPEWFWATSVLAGAGAAGLYFGHERAERNALPKP